MAGERSVAPKSRTSKTSKKAGRGKDVSEEGIPASRVFGFSVGMLLLSVALFLLLAFSSYVYSGATDYSFCESHSPGEIFDADLRVRNLCGKLGVCVAYFFINNLFGVASYCVPVFLMLVALCLIGSYRMNLLKLFVKLAVFMLWLSIVLTVVTAWLPFMDDSHVSLGGQHGRYVCTQLENLVGVVGVYGLIALTLVFLLVYFSKRTIDYCASLFRPKWIARRKSQAEEQAEDARPADGDDKADSPESPVAEYKDPEKASMLKYDANGNLVLRTDEQSVPQDETPAAVRTAASENAPDAPKPEAGAENPAEEKTEATFEINAPAPTEKGKDGDSHDEELTPYDPRLDLEHYKYPPLNLLDHGTDSAPKIDLAEQNANKNRIIHVLKSFGVEISSITATIGPTITLYEITPAEGMRINKIRNLEDDIALSLAAEGIRIIAPIPGKGTIGIEVPNKKKCIVSMESVLNSKTFHESKMALPCALGKTITNEVFMVDLAKAPHMLVAGATGQGKSVGLNAIVTSLLYKKHPSELKFVMVDPKKVEFSVYAPIANQFLAKLEDEEDAIITDNQRVVKTLNALCKLMDDRYLLLKQAKVRNIKEYNEKFIQRKLSPLDGHDYMPYYVVVIDEFGDLIMTAGKEIEHPICRIAQLARAVGIHMIIATQRPTTSIITGTIKANFPARVAFKVSSMMDSRVILDRPGANQLIGRGDMLYLQNADPVRVQCAFVDTPEVNRICHFIEEQQKYPQMTFLPEPPESDEGGGDKDVDMARLDPLFADVAKMVVAQDAGSTSAIQRKFSIGYNRAGRLMDQLEKVGVVGAQQGSKPREVLIKDVLSLESLLNTLDLN